MPEEQNVSGEIWNKRLNLFIKNVLRWQQLGQSNNDVYCEQLKKKVGIDSVFAYRRNPTCHPQVAIVEAKSYQKVKNLDRSKLQKWVDDLIEKLTNIPTAPNFHQQFNPELDAEYQLGLIALWLAEYDLQSSELLRTWLSQIEVPQFQVPLNVCFISNDSFTRFSGIHQEIQSLEKQGDFKDIAYFFPDYGPQPRADGSCIPIEGLLSKFVICKAKGVQKLIGSKESNEYPAYLVFYLGTIENYHDLRFIGLALQYFQLMEAGHVEIYTLYDIAFLRNHIETFKGDFAKSNVEFGFRKLNIAPSWPNWLEKND